MIFNYLKIAWRNLWRNKGFSALNILCLSIGLTFSMLIGIYVLNQYAVNSTIKNIASQYVIKSKWKQENMGSPVATLGPLAKTIKDEYPNLVENYYRFDPVSNIVSAGNKHFRTQIYVGDTTLVSMYGFQLLQGNPRRAFIDNQSAVVTEELALKFFGRTNVVGETLTVQTPADGGKHSFIISAVLRDPPFNTVTNFTLSTCQVYLPMEANQYFQGGDKGNNWSNVFMVSMLQLKKGVTANDLARPLANTLSKYQPAFVKDNLQAALSAMKDYYLKQNNGAVQNMVTTLSLIAAFILLLAIINFINISIGTSMHRLKEIGLRKVFGGSKVQIIVQYMLEASMLTTIAVLLSLQLYQLLVPVFNLLLNTRLDDYRQFGAGKWCLIAGLTMSVGFVSGIYPAFVLSSSNVVNAVKGKMDSVGAGLTLRKSLLIVQFTLAIVVFIGAINISRQVAYIFNKDIGFKKDQVMIVSSLPRASDSAGVVRMENLKSGLMQVPGVKSISLSYDIPDGSEGGNVNVYSPGHTDFTSMIMLAADAGFSKVYGLDIKEGIFLQPDNSEYRSGRIVMNETAVKTLGWTSAVGKTIRLGGPAGPIETVAGVVKDFHFESMQKEIQPMIIAGLNESFTRSYRYFSIKIQPAGIANTITSIQEKCRELFPETGFEYSFMDDKFKAIYQSELQLKKAADIGTVLNLVIIFTGIFGVVAFTLTKRTKEIAVRKVLGAGVKNILSIFLKEYGFLILIANAIAWPLAYLITTRWLENYVYRVQQNVTLYVFACLFILATAFVLIIAQCMKAALANPVRSLRSE